MQKRSSKKKRQDINELAASIVGQTIKGQINDLDGKNPNAVMLGRLGGLKGAKQEPKS